MRRICKFIISRVNMFNSNKDRAPNIGVLHGAWGETVASKYLKGRGYVILERNARPCKDDARLEIDIVAYSSSGSVIVFVEVKQHASRSVYQRRLRSIDARKRRLMRRVCKAWLMQKHWAGAYRFDVIEVYGTPSGATAPEIDHIERVNIFASREKYVNWSE